MYFFRIDNKCSEQNLVSMNDVAFCFAPNIVGSRSKFCFCCTGDLFAAELLCAKRDERTMPNIFS